MSEFDSEDRAWWIISLCFTKHFQANARLNIQCYRMATQMTREIGLGLYIIGLGALTTHHHSEIH